MRWCKQYCNFAWTPWSGFRRTVEGAPKALTSALDLRDDLLVRLQICACVGEIQRNCQEGGRRGGAHKRSACKKDASITGTTIDRSWRWGQVRHRRGVNPVDPPCTSSCPCGRITIANALSQAIDRGLCAGAMTAAHMGGASIEAPSVASPLSHRVAMLQIR